MAQIPIATGLFTWPSSQPRLLGSRCDACGAHTFPSQGACPRCAAKDVTEVELSPKGTLWTWTSQDLIPKAPPYAGPETPESFERYFVGYVELDDELRVEARLSGFDDSQPRIGQAVQLEIVPFKVDEDGNEVMIYTFAPAKEADRASGVATRLTTPRPS